MDREVVLHVEGGTLGVGDGDGDGHLEAVICVRCLVVVLERDTLVSARFDTETQNHGRVNRRNLGCACVAIHVAEE